MCCSPLGACSAHAKTGLDAHSGPSAQTEAWQVVRSTRCAALDTGRPPLEMRQVCHGSDFACSAVGAHASNVVLAQPCQHARACCACLPARRRRISCFCPLTCRRTDRLANFFERAATAGGRCAESRAACGVPILLRATPAGHGRLRLRHRQDASGGWKRRRSLKQMRRHLQRRWRR